MHCRSAVLATADVEGTLLEVEHVPAHGDELTGSKAMPVGDEDHGCVAVGVPTRVLLGEGDEAVDLFGGEVLAGTHVGVLGAPRDHCSFFDGWSLPLPRRKTFVSHRPSIRHCSFYGHDMDCSFYEHWAIRILIT